MSERSERNKKVLAGSRILIVEDDFLIALELQTTLEDAGAEIIGPARTVEAGLRLANEELSAAVLDMRLGDVSIEPIAARLAARGVPFMFYTGQLGSDPTKIRWPHVKLIPKPTPSRVLVNELAALTALELQR